MGVGADIGLGKPQNDRKALCTPCEMQVNLCNRLYKNLLFFTITAPITRVCVTFAGRTTKNPICVQMGLVQGAG